MLRIGFSGTNWTGKGESICRFTRQYPNKNIEIVSLSKLVKQCPFPMGHEQTLEGSEWMVEQVTNRLENPKREIEIFDRTPLDILAFTLYAICKTNKNEVNLPCVIRGLLEYFDTIFYLQPSNEWPVNVCKTESEVWFALLIDFFMREAIKRWGIKVVPLPWDQSERQKLLAEFFSEWETN